MTTTHNKTNSFLSVLALIIAILSMIIGWAAYNRSGADLEDQIQAAVETAVDEAVEGLDEAQEEVRDETAEGLRDGAEAIDTDEK